MQNAGLRIRAEGIAVMATEHCVPIVVRNCTLIPNKTVSLIYREREEKENSLILRARAKKVSLIQEKENSLIQVRTGDLPHVKRT